MNSRVTCGADNFLPSRATAISAVNMHTTVTVGSGRTAETLVRSQAGPCGIVVDKVTLGQVLVQVLGSGSLYQYFIVGRRVKWSWHQCCWYQCAGSGVTTDCHTAVLSIQPRATTLLADTTLLRHLYRPHSSLYKLRVGATGFILVFWTLKIEPLSRNVPKHSVLLAAQYRRIAQFSCDRLFGCCRPAVIWNGKAVTLSMSRNASSFCSAVQMFKNTVLSGLTQQVSIGVTLPIVSLDLTSIFLTNSDLEWKQTSDGASERRVSLCPLFLLWTIDVWQSRIVCVLFIVTETETEALWKDFI